jgi:thioredoxin-related protein
VFAELVNGVAWWCKDWVVAENSLACSALSSMSFTKYGDLDRMKRKITLWIASLLVAGSAIGQTNETVDIDGAVSGKWTMDFDAAKKLASEKKLPILLNFSGSDWSEVMESNVFTKPEWGAYAKENVIMVLIDFPKDKSLVPEKYVERNAALQSEFGIEGFPTFVVLDDDGTTELGRLGSGQDKTPASFQAEIELLFRNRPSTLAAYAATLSPAAKATYESLTSKMEDHQKAIKAAEIAMASAGQKIDQLNESIEQLEENLQDFRVAQLSEEEQEKFKSLKEAFEATRTEIITWLATEPEPNEENTEKFHTLQAEMQATSTQLDTY